LGFVFGVLLYATFVFALCLARFIIYGMSLGMQTALKEAPVSFALIFVTAISISLVGFLGFFHCQLLAANLTTNEQITMKYGAGTPYHAPFWKYLYNICCLSLSPSFIKLTLPKERIQEMTDYP